MLQSESCSDRLVQESTVSTRPLLLQSQGLSCSQFSLTWKNVLFIGFISVFRMFLWWTRRLWSSAVSVSVCCHAAVFLLLTRSCEGQYQMVGPSTPVLAMLGVDVVLPCHLEPAADETKSTVEWSRSDLSPRFVHLRRDGVDLLIDQHPSYARRTHLSSSRLKLGDLSLRLSNVKLSDEGKYSCIVPGKTSTEVHLLVGEWSEEALTSLSLYQSP
uniref:Ig-like domain-containing protein n=1 Tax=Salarias fasciatus TaxID=181472 RepID=A0A672HJ00_SALFA